MPTSAVIMSRMDNVMREGILPRIEAQIPRYTPALERFNKKAVGVDSSGRGMRTYIPMQIGLNEKGVGSRAEGGALPSAEYTEYNRAYVDLKYHYATIQVTGQALDMSEDSPEALVTALNGEVEGVALAAGREMARQMWADDSGFLCMTNGTGTGATALVVDNPGGAMLAKNMYIVSYPDTTTGAAVADNDIGEGIAAGIKISAVSGNNITLATSDTWADNRYIYRTGNRGNAMTGLRAIFDNYALRATTSWFGLATAVQTIQGLDRNTETYMDALVEHNSNTAQDITEDTIQTGLDNLFNEAQGGYPTVLWSHTTPRRTYLREIAADRRFPGVGTDGKYTGGFSFIKYESDGQGAIPWYCDPMCTPNTLYGLDETTMFLFHRRTVRADGSPGAGWKWDKDRLGNTMWERKTDSNGRYDVWVATMKNYQNIGCNNIKKSVVWRDVQ